MNRSALPTSAYGQRRRFRIEVTGAVQGVGFRPFVHRLAVSEELSGFVRNTAHGVEVEVEGALQALERFSLRLETETVAPAAVSGRRINEITPRGGREFMIAPSVPGMGELGVVLPDMAICEQCVAEIFDASNRRYRYPFTTCAQCGPRFSIMEGVPFDRERTTMRGFAMCAACQAEYDNPSSRRFHAQTNACPACGPQLTLLNAAGRECAIGYDAVRRAGDAIRSGSILAMKGLGGYQLLVDAGNDHAVRRLRERKHRPSKPFAIMAPCYEDAQTLAVISDEERRTLCSTAAPIVILRARGEGIAPSVAPANAWLGLMLPYTPLHHLLMHELGFAVVATSGNRGGEPIVADNLEAIEQLADVADGFLVHDRPIANPVDDSVARVIAGEATVLRHARGYAPLALRLPGHQTRDDAGTCLALGGHGKSAIALMSGSHVVLGPYIGDLEGAGARTAFARTVAAMTSLFSAEPRSAACDAHPDYWSSRFARHSLVTNIQHVPHHLAHVLACMVENNLEGPLLGVAWDGSGYGGDGTIWGGEFLWVQGNRYRQVGQLQPFRLPGGEVAAREVNRAAIGALFAVYGDVALTMTELRPIAHLSASEQQIYKTLLSGGFRSPWTSSAGRLFDAAAAMLGICATSSFEGEAAIALESAAANGESEHVLAAAMLREEQGRWIADWRPTLAALASASQRHEAPAALAAAFHDALAQVIVNVAERVGVGRVLLTGGCFQNARLTGGAVARLRAAGFDVWQHRRIPPNDGGLAVGQAAFAAQPMLEGPR
ncbi:carbamoyltransferase HypF (plasmid) [Pandoraea vervacti]|uniref:Carbamoyltransferase HypF n=1 Tax=Pandoraea vervacti TaxID=656178 RepID=A0ABM5T5A5_9BURK|nr:carbamoyltransferase HypF [Pandoraea vervacti]